MSAVIYHRRAETARRVLWAFMILCGLGLLVLLYSFKTMAQTARKTVHQLEVQIETEENNVRLLKAEIVFLERPDRLQALSEATLALTPETFKVQDDLALIRTIPFRDEIASHNGGRP